MAIGAVVSGGSHASASGGWIRPWPKTLSRPAAPRSSAVALIAVSTSASVNSGWTDRIRAARPATCGVAMLVPLIAQYVLFLYVEAIETPGAATSTIGPKLLKLAFASPFVVAATETTFANDAG